MSDSIGNKIATLLILAVFGAGFALGWTTRGEEPLTVTSCAASSRVAFELKGDRVTVRCAP